MTPLPHLLLKEARKLAYSAPFAGLCGTAMVVAMVLVLAMLPVTTHGAEMPPEAAPPPGDSEVLPQPLKGEAFEGLLANSPFTRSLGISDSLILTGVARFNNEVHATLLDTQTMESHVVSKTPNREGWQLIDIGGDPAQMHTWTAKIQMQGGQVTVIRYQKPPPKPARGTSGARGSGGSSGGSQAPLSASQVEEAKKAAVNYREGFTSDGYPRQPPPEMVEKLSRLSVQQREDINRQMIGIRNQGLGMDERRRIYENMVDRASGSRR